LSSPTTNPTSSQSGTFTFVGSCEANATVNLTSTTSGQNAVSPAPSATTTCSAGGAFSISQSLGTAGTQSGDGTYVYSLTQTDAGGNTSAAVTFTWTKDYLIPSTPTLSAPTPINSNGIHYTTSTAQTISITVSCTYSPSIHELTFVENGVIVSNVTCPISGTHTYTTTNHSDGTFPFEIYQTNVNVTPPKSSAAAAFTWVRDTTTPAAPTFTNPNTSTITAPTTLYLAGTCESSATIIIYIGGVEEKQTSCSTGTFSTSITRSGALANYSVTARQRDPAGNLSVSSSTITWTQDPNAVPIPNITFPSGGSSISNSDELVLQGICVPNNYVTISAGSGTTLTGSDIITPAGSFTQSCPAGGTYAYTISKTGSTASTNYNFNITQSATLGGTSSAASPFRWTRDTVAPTVTITAATSNEYSGNALFTLSANEASIAYYKCSTDNSTFTTCISPYVYSFASETNPSTSHNVQRQIWVKALDTAGNTGSTATLLWTPTIYNTSLLYKFDGNSTNSSTYNSSVASNLTVTGATYTNASQGKFSNALDFSRATDTATLTDNAILGTFLSTATIEFWMQNNFTTSGTIMNHQASTTSGLSWSINVAKAGSNTYNITFTGSSNGSFATTITGACGLTKSNSAWQHIAVTFNKGSVVVYCNGTNAGEGSIPANNGVSRLFDSTGTFTIGGLVYKMDELRISQGIRYTGNFTAPTAAFTAD
jgi:hypothetical protein